MKIFIFKNVKIKTMSEPHDMPSSYSYSYSNIESKFDNLNPSLLTVLSRFLGQMLILGYNNNVLFKFLGLFLYEPNKVFNYVFIALMILVFFIQRKQQFLEN